MRTLLIDATGEVPPDAKQVVRATLREASRRLEVGPGDLALRIVDGEAMRRLNHRFRRRDSPTDVLSFPGGEPLEPGAPPHLGDVAICLDVARRQAVRRRHSLERELALLALHGLLHVLGYDHETDDGTMERLERRLRRETLPGRGRS
ncbi:MAG: rRNA maturation RNase YbeY [Acidobacteriota bacterium]|nr:rRNA maturation RNase YbeY [Acidobacteriota bacterium]